MEAIVDFSQAWEAFNKGKKIRSLNTGWSYKLEGEVSVKVTDAMECFEFETRDVVMFTVNEINGKWIIEEE